MDRVNKRFNPSKRTGTENMNSEGKEKPNARKTPTGTGIALGAGLGVAFGSLYGQLATGLALGVALGAAFDVVSHVRHKKND